MLLVSACFSVPKYKRANGRFDEWELYETKHFYPSNGTVTAVDPAAGTVTILNGKNSRVFTVTAGTRIMHEGTDIPLAQLPLNQTIKYTLSQDGSRLLTIWYGTRTFEFHRPGSAQHAATPL